MTNENINFESKAYTFP